MNLAGLKAEPPNECLFALPGNGVVIGASVPVGSGVAGVDTSGGGSVVDIIGVVMGSVDGPSVGGSVVINGGGVTPPLKISTQKITHSILRQHWLFVIFKVHL